MAVLGTKLHVPATRRPLVARPRLTELVRSGASELPRLVLVSAPAGFGKTTLLSQWLSPARPGGQAPRVAWLSLDAGEPLQRLLGEVGRRPATGEHVRAVRAAGSAAAALLTTTDGPGQGTLSDRELEVLRLLATPMSGPEIARQLFVSINTLRTHTKRIFTKLDVNTRAAAVSRAADLGLLQAS